MTESAAASLPATNVGRDLLAACTVLAPILIAASFLADPTGGIPPAYPALAEAFRAAGTARLDLFLALNAAVVLVFVPSFLGLGALTVPRVPRIGLIATVAGILGAVPFALFVGTEALAAQLATTTPTGPAQVIWNGVAGTPAVTALQLCWVLGHLTAYALFGVALLRARLVPRPAAAVLIAAVPLQAAAYPAHQPWLQVLGFALAALAGCYAATALHAGGRAAGRAE